MKIDGFWPNPTWIERFAQEEEQIAERHRFVLRVAALYHNRSGSLQKLSAALGYSSNALHQASTQGRVTPECAIKLEKLLGREHFPRELFRPDIFSVA